MPKIHPTDVLVNETIRNAEESARRMSAAVPAYYRNSYKVVRRGSTTLRFVAPDLPSSEDVLDGWED